MQSYEVFYIPGLGDQDSIDRQRKYVDFLNRHRKSLIFFFDTLWETDEPAETKLSRLFKAYEDCQRPKTIFGVSAGASLAIILGEKYAETRLVTIAGKHKGAATIGEDYQTRAPSLKPIVQQSQQILAANSDITSRLKTYRPWPVDGIVPKSDIQIESASNKIILVPFHAPAIVAALATILPRL